jgi:hypothetical protein
MFPAPNNHRSAFRLDFTSWFAPQATSNVTVQEKTRALGRRICGMDALTPFHLRLTFVCPLCKTLNGSADDDPGFEL